MAKKTTKKELRETMVRATLSRTAKVEFNRCSVKRLDVQALFSIMKALFANVTPAECRNAYPVRGFDASGKVLERLCVDKRKFSGLIGFGSPQLRAMIEHVGCSPAVFCEVRQGKNKNYWFCNPAKVSAYLVSKYAPERDKELLGATLKELAELFA